MTQQEKSEFHETTRELSKCKYKLPKHFNVNYNYTSLNVKKQHTKLYEWEHCRSVNTYVKVTIYFSVIFLIS